MPAGLSVRSRFQKFLSVCVALLLGVSLVSVLGQGMARAAVVCPTVAPTVPHTVTPAPQSGDNWSGCDLTDAYLQGVDLSGVNFTGANLTGVSMWFATITGADFTNVNFGTGLSVYGLVGTPTALPSGWGIYQTRLVGPGANIAGVGFIGVNFVDVDFSGANITGTDFIYASFVGCKSGGLIGLPSRGATVIGGYIFAPGVDLQDADLTGLDISGVDLRGVSSGGVIGLPTLPTGYQLVGDGYIVGPGVRLTGVNIDGFDLASINLNGVISGGVTGTPASLPTGMILLGGYLIGAYANLTDADLTGLDLTGADLNHAAIGNANFSGTTLTGVSSGYLSGTPINVPSPWVLLNGYLVGPGANLRNAGLSPIDFGTADLTNADLSGANLSGSNLSAATLDGIKSNGVLGDMALPPTWLNIRGCACPSGLLVGPKANLAGADITYLNMAAATLTGVRSGSVTGRSYLLPAGWVLLQGYLVGPSADLRGANLSNQSLDGLNLTDVDLTGADITNSTFVGTTWSNTTCVDGSNSSIHIGGSCLNALDTTAPAGGSLTVNGVSATAGGSTSYSTGTFSGTFTDFTDAALASNTVTRSVGTNTAGVCSSFGDGLPVPSISETSAAVGCYRYVLTGLDLAGNSSSLQTTVIVGAAPTTTAVTSGTYKVGYKITCNAVATNTDGAAQIAWLNNGVVIAGQASATYTLPATMYNRSISCRVTVSNAYASPPPTTSASHLVGLGNKPALKTAPVITKTVKVGTRIYASKGTWSLSGLSYSYQWKRSGKAIAGSAARSSSWKVVAADKGKYLTCTVTVKKSGYASNSATTGRKKAA
ncbi:unannotated protein [freshwater metagenome]|uniref:Unannotated protein n=1 Tax=freshwater metagenome TaxID=449393 RepID=A0A6J7E4P4_9ZZZZ|nr:hypothetical protein [Actinomycetota bacterium]